MTTCTRPNCGDPRYRAGACFLHYRKRHRLGHTRRLSAEPVRHHLDALHARGWTNVEITQYCGVAASTIQAILYRHYRTDTVNRETARRLLGVPLDKHDGTYTRVPVIGFRRRAQALAYMGWGMKDQSRLMGLGTTTVEAVARRATGTVTLRLHRGMCELFDRLALEHGPNTVAAGLARTRGYAPPLAWDDDTIDDPEAEANFGRHRTLGDDIARGAA